MSFIRNTIDSLEGAGAVGKAVLAASTKEEAQDAIGLDAAISIEANARIQADNALSERIDNVEDAVANGFDHVVETVGDLPSTANSSGRIETARVVNDDQDPDNNGAYWRDVGETSWTKIPGDDSGRLTNLETKTTDIQRRTAGFGDGTPDFLEFGESVNGRVYRTVDTDGKHWLKFSDEVHDTIASETAQRPEFAAVQKIKDGVVGESLVDLQNGRTIPFEQALSGGFSAGIPLSVYADEVPDCCWNQWVWPELLEVPRDGFVGAAPISRGIRASGSVPLAPGRLWAIQKKRGGLLTAAQPAAIRSTSGSFSSDDHNAGALLPDLRGTARSPLTIIQSEHGGPPPRLLEFSGMDIGRYIGERTIPDGFSSASYAQTARNPANPDEIVVWYRKGSTDSARWVAARSTDNGLSWVHVAVFGDESSGLYMLAKESFAGDGFVICFHDHVITGEDQRLAYLHLSWAGELSDPVNGTHIANIFDGTLDWQHNPFAEDAALIVRTPAAGHHTRLFDFGQHHPERIHLAFVEFEPGPANDYTGLNTEYRYLNLNLATGAVLHDVRVTDAGWPIDQGTTERGYFGGIAVIGDFEVVVARWECSSYSDYLNGIGTGKLLRLKSSDAGSSWDTISEEAATNLKYIRPINGAKYEPITGGSHRHRHGDYYAYLLGTYIEYHDTWTTGFYLRKK